MFVTCTEEETQEGGGVTAFRGTQPVAVKIGYFETEFMHLFIIRHFRPELDCPAKTICTWRPRCDVGLYYWAYAQAMCLERAAASVEPWWPGIF